MDEEASPSSLNHAIKLSHDQSIGWIKECLARMEIRASMSDAAPPIISALFFLFGVELRCPRLVVNFRGFGCTVVDVLSNSRELHCILVNLSTLTLLRERDYTSNSMLHAQKFLELRFADRSS